MPDSSPGEEENLGRAEDRYSMTGAALLTPTGQRARARVRVSSSVRHSVSQYIKSIRSPQGCPGVPCNPDGQAAGAERVPLAIGRLCTDGAGENGRTVRSAT